MKAKELRRACEIFARIPEIAETRGRARFLKKIGNRTAARAIQRASNRAERKAARRELASMALA